MIGYVVVGAAVGYVGDGLENAIQKIVNDKTNGSQYSNIKFMATVVIQTIQTIVASQFLRQALPVIGLGACRFLLPASTVALVAISVVRAAQRWKQGNSIDSKETREYYRRSERTESFSAGYIRPLGDHIGTITHFTIIASIVARAFVDLASIDTVETFLAISLTCGLLDRGDQLNADVSKVLDWTRFIALSYWVSGDPVMVGMLIGCKAVGTDIFSILSMKSKSEETPRYINQRKLRTYTRDSNYYKTN